MERDFSAKSPALFAFGKTSDKKDIRRVENIK